MVRKASTLVPPRAPELRKRTFSQAGLQPEARSAPPEQASLSPLLTQGQFALALSLGKSKPQDFSTTSEYIDQLQKRIKVGREEQHRHIDTADFWKDQYSKLLVEKNAWESRALSLSSNEQDYVQPVASESAHDMAELAYKPFTCVALLRQTQVLVKQLTDANIDALTLLESLQTTLLRMSSLISQVCEQPRLLRPNEDNNIHREGYVEEVIHTVGLAYLQCLRGFNHLCRDIPGRQNKNTIVHGFSKLFSKILAHIHKTCEASVQNSKRSNTARTGGGISSSGSSSTSRYDVINMSLSKLLVVMITNDDFDEEYPGHLEILEGYLFHLLQHTGSTLSEVVFLEQVSGADTNGNGNRRDATKEEPDPAAQMKGRYLVYILTQVIKKNSKVSKMLNDLSSRGNFTRGRKAHIGNGQLSTEAKKRLQHTLLKGVFGGDDFKNCLKEPSNPGQDSNTLVSVEAAEPEQFSTEWFVESLWSLIGWDILSEKK